MFDFELVKVLLEHVVLVLGRHQLLSDRILTLQLVQLHLIQLLQNDLQLFCSTRNVNNVSRIKAALKTNLECHWKRQKHIRMSTSENEKR